jgi:hypothetical protein
MIYSVLRLTKSDGITFDNDAKSCFDRIVQRLGLSPEVMELFIATLSKVEYIAKTFYGLSTLPYRSTSSHGIHGPGQGGRASPAIWTAISCRLLQCMRENSICANILSPNGHQIHQVSSGFVDDITHWCIAMEDTICAAGSGEQLLMEQMLDTAQLWEQLLYITGGKLELSKYFYYPIIWLRFNSNISCATASLSDTLWPAPRPCRSVLKMWVVARLPKPFRNAERYCRYITPSTFQLHMVLVKSTLD